MLFSAVADTPPIQFGPYLLTERVGQGGMAVVYKATRHGPSGFEKTVVVKAMLPGLSARQEFVAMFSAEARLMAQLQHPNIVQVHDFGIVDGVPYLAMEYLAGRNLSQLRGAVAAIAQRVPMGAALAIAREVCHGLAYAHDFVDVDGRRRQIIHRDVSPSNIMVCRDGSVKLLDFGVAKIVGQFDYEVTQSFKGKYAYMAPEQVMRKPIDRRVDVFALGVVLHELLTSRRLFAAETELETLQKVAAAKAGAPSADNREVPRVLDGIVAKALAKDPARRYASGAELAEALETLDALAWSRKRLATWVNELFGRDWQVICEVCGKPVTVGAMCGECGTRASEASRPIEVDVEIEEADSAGAGAGASGVAADDSSESQVSDDAQTLMGAGRTERNVIDEALLPLQPASLSEPMPLPPMPAAPVATRRPRLAVVRTPLPRPSPVPGTSVVAPLPPPPPVGAPSLSLVPPRPITPLPPPTMPAMARPITPPPPSSSVEPVMEPLMGPSMSPARTPPPPTEPTIPVAQGPSMSPARTPPPPTEPTIPVAQGPGSRAKTPSQPKVPAAPPAMTTKTRSQPKLPAPGPPATTGKTPSQPKLPGVAPAATKTTSQPKLPGVPPASGPLGPPSRGSVVQPVHAKGSASQSKMSSPGQAQPNAPSAPARRGHAISGSIARDTPLPRPFMPPAETLSGPRHPLAMPLPPPAPNPSFVPVALRAPLFEAPADLPTLSSYTPPPPSPSTSRLSQRMLSATPPRSSRVLLTVTTLMLALAVAGAVAVSLRGPQRIEPTDVLAPTAAGSPVTPTTVTPTTVTSTTVTPKTVTPKTVTPRTVTVRAPVPAAVVPAPVAPAPDVRALEPDGDAATTAGSEPARRPAHHRSSRPRSSSPAAATGDPDRTIKEGRIVDPFASMK